MLISLYGILIIFFCLIVIYITGITTIIKLLWNLCYILKKTIIKDKINTDYKYYTLINSCIIEGNENNFDIIKITNHKSNCIFYSDSISDINLNKNNIYGSVLIIEFDDQSNLKIDCSYILEKIINIQLTMDFTIYFILYIENYNKYGKIIKASIELLDSNFITDTYIYNQDNNPMINFYKYKG
jgi:hypothetical protein